jgi:hypothetical protein
VWAILGYIVSAGAIGRECIIYSDYLTHSKWIMRRCGIHHTTFNGCGSFNGTAGEEMNREAVVLVRWWG